jgi:hypothetical protein
MTVLAGPAGSQRNAKLGAGHSPPRSPPCEATPRRNSRPTSRCSASGNGWRRARPCRSGSELGGCRPTTVSLILSDSWRARAPLGLHGLSPARIPGLSGATLCAWDRESRSRAPAAQARRRSLPHWQDGWHCRTSSSTRSTTVPIGASHPQLERAAGRAAARTGQALDPQQLLLTFPGRAFLTWMEGHPEKALDHMRSFLADAQRRGDLQGVSVGQ